MAVVAVTHNITRLEDFEGTPTGTFGNTGLGGGPGAAAAAGLHYEAAQAASRRIAGTGDERGFTYILPATPGAQNMTSVGNHVYLVKAFTALAAVINAEGTRMGIGDGVGDYFNYQVGEDGSGFNGDLALPPKGGYVLIPIEVRLTAWHNLIRVGTPDITIVDMFRMSHNVSQTTGAGTSQALDSIDITSDALFLVGGDSTDPDGTFQDFADADEGQGVSGAGRAGLWASLAGVFFAYGPNVIGRDDAASVTATVFTDSLQTIIFPGGFVEAGWNGLEFDLGNATTVITLVNVSITGQGRIDYKAYFDTELDVTGGATDTINIPGHLFQNGDQVAYSAEGGSEDIGPDATAGEGNAYTSITPPTGDRWYVSVVDANTIQLHATADLAFQPITPQDLTASGAGLGENHSLRRLPDIRPDITFTGNTGLATMTSMTFVGIRNMTLTSAVTMTGGVIVNVGQIDVAGGTLDTVTISLPTVTAGESTVIASADEYNDIFDTTFNGNSNVSIHVAGHAVEIDVSPTADLASVGNIFNNYGPALQPFNALNDVDVDADDRIDLTAHPYVDGDPVYYMINDPVTGTAGTVIAGLVTGNLYYVRSVSANEITLHLTREGAETNTNVIGLTAGVDEDHVLYSAYAAVHNSTTADVVLAVSGGGDSPTYRNSSTGTVTVQSAVTIRVEGLTEGAACKVVANETAGTITIGDTIFEQLADSNGVAQITTFNYEGAFGAGLDLLVRTAQQGLPNAALQDNNSVFTDFTTEANSTITDDMVMFPAVPVANEDRFQFGHAEQFTRLKIQLGTVGAGGFTITWEYWNGSIWTALSDVVDGTSNLTATGENIVSWTLPGDWATRTDGGLGPFFYVRAHYTAGTMSTVPLGRKGQLDVTRYITAEAARVVTSSGLTTTASHVVDTISKFDPND